MNIILEEFNRDKITIITKKLKSDISKINSGVYLTPTEQQTNYMKEIHQFNIELNTLRENKRKLNNEELYLLEKLENEWKKLYKLVKDYDLVAAKYNLTHRNKILTFKERTAYNLNECRSYFNY